MASVNLQTIGQSMYGTPILIVGKKWGSNAIRLCNCQTGPMHIFCDCKKISSVIYYIKLQMMPICIHCTPFHILVDSLFCPRIALDVTYSINTHSALQSLIVSSYKKGMMHHQMCVCACARVCGCVCVNFKSDTEP